MYIIVYPSPGYCNYFLRNLSISESKYAPFQVPLKEISMETELLPRLKGRKLKIWQDFLAKAGLEADLNSDTTALIWDADSLVAAGSRLGNLLKCIAVEESRQGEGLTATLLTALRQDAFSAGHRHLFLYTKPKNRAFFSSLFFYPVVQTSQVLLMEDRRNGIRDFLHSLPNPHREGKIGALVMNCNPFTLGHRHLIATAAAECDHVYVFILSEDRSRFSARDRMEMVLAGTRDLANVTVLPTGPYLISSATFPTYFLPDRETASQAKCQLDIQIFLQYYVPHFGINLRYVGTEPLSPMTDLYNAALERSLPPAGVALRLIPRLTTADGTPISASAVRAHLDAGETEALRNLVPDTTQKHLQSAGLI